MKFLKGHGTENDFVLLPDPEGRLALTPELVGRICDRRAGLGADGILRMVPIALEPDAAPMSDESAGGARWFMDHWNADGTRPEMCGNGIRLFGRHLVRSGLARPGRVRVATRGGLKELDVEPGDGLVSVDMGPARPGEAVHVDGQLASFVDMGNPHAVVAVESLAALGVLAPDRLDLNVEYVEEIGPAHLAMRVHERGVGETRSCGTGACAAVVAHVLRTGAPRQTYAVDVPGGRLHVTWREDGHVTLAGPAVVVAEGELRADWLAAAISVA